MKPGLIRYGSQSISQEDIASVVAILQSDFLTQGPAVIDFEAALSARCAAKHAIACNSATSALHLACLAAGLSEGDWLWTSPNTFVASANCARYCGADVDFVDIDVRTLNMDVVKLKKKLEQARKDNRLPKIVVAVAFSGRSCEMEGIHSLAEEYQFTVIEDASHALGASYQGLPVGCGTYADMTVFSFHPVKIITTAEGGAILTNSERLSQQLRSLRSHGVMRDAQKMDQDSHGPWYYQMQELGFNYRLTDIQAALGLSQLMRLDAFLARRRERVECYQEAFSDLPLTLPVADDHIQSAWHLYVIRLQQDKISKTRREIFDELRAASIEVNVHYIPVHLHPYYRRLGFSAGDFPEAERYYDCAISLPMHAALSHEEQDHVISSVRKSLS
jgi:UDP-4-amino-4,6-dideoxy-N-acetyl-beta-L-altrosamine transaminase